MQKKQSEQIKSDYTIERLQPSDVEAMATLHTNVWLTTLTDKAFGVDLAWAKERMKEKYSASEIAKIKQATVEDAGETEKIWFVAKNKAGKVIGMARPYRHDEEGLQRVGAMYVDKDWQGKGVANELMKKVIEWSRPDQPLYLWVAAKNERAKHFYIRWGFEVVEGKNNIVYGKVPHVQMARKVGK